jgi:hypothetical protein
MRIAVCTSRRAKGPIAWLSVGLDSSTAESEDINRKLGTEVCMTPPGQNAAMIAVANARALA